MFQNGLSSSPSNTEPPFNGPNFPLISIRDNVNAGYKLVTEIFKVKKIKGVIGFSMGAQQAFQWGVSYPDFVEKIVGIAGSAVEYPHGIVRLEGFISAIEADASFENGKYKSPPEVGLRAGGAHWASWGWSQEWYRLGLYKEMGLNDSDEVIDWFEEFVLTWDANNLIALARTWQNNNIGDTPGFNGNYSEALGSIKADVLYMPSETDMYFHIDALTREANMIPGVKLKVIPSLWGHIAGAGFSSEDVEFINKEIKEFYE
jgi:homoserine O-acetyltransferase